MSWWVPTGNGELAKSEFPSYWPIQLWILWPMTNCKFLKCRTIFRYIYRENNNCMNDRIILVYKCIVTKIHTISIQLKPQLVMTLIIIIKH